MGWLTWILTDERLLESKRATMQPSRTGHECSWPKRENQLFCQKNWDFCHETSLTSGLFGYGNAVLRLDVDAALGRNLQDLEHDSNDSENGKHRERRLRLKIVGQEPLEILRCRPQSSCPGGAPGRGLCDLCVMKNIKMVSCFHALFWPSH